MEKVDVIFDYWLTTFDSRESAIEYFKKCSEDAKGVDKIKYNDMVLILENSSENMVSDGNKYYGKDYIFGINNYNEENCVPYIQFLQPMKYSDYKEMELNIPHYKKLDNNLEIIDTNYRNIEPIALVKKETKYHTEYIIAFNYLIENNNMVWGYGRYYYDLEIAKEEFKNVIEGNYLDYSSKELKVKFIGIDDWNRPVYCDEDKNLYKDINLGEGTISLCNVCENDFYGEPEAPINENVEVKIIKEFNKNKEQER